MSTPRLHHPRPHRRSHRALGGLVASLTAVALSGALGASPAAATDEFPSKPTAVATLTCVPGDGATLDLDLGNVGGLSSAHFDVTRTGVPDTAYDVAQGTTTRQTSYDLLQENTDVTVSVTADHGFAYTVTLHVDCTGFVGGLVLTCDGATPVVTAVSTAIGILGDEVFLQDGFDTLDWAHLEPGESVTMSTEVPDEVPFTLTLQSDADGTISDLTGTPHCALPTPTTEPEPEVTPTDPPPPPATDPAPVSAAEVLAAPSPAPAPNPAPTELPRTGSSTVPLVVVGSTLLGLGLTLCRAVAARNRRC